MPTYEFSCGQHRHERRVGYDIASVTCPTCGGAAVKESVYAVRFGGFARTPSDQRDYSRDYKAFREASEDVAYHESVATRVEGVPVQGPNFFQAAKAKADDLISKGVRDVNDL